MCVPPRGCCEPSPRGSSAPDPAGYGFRKWPALGLDPRDHAPSTGDEVMPKLIEMDDTVTLSRQMQASVGPVVLVNKFSVAAGDIDRCVAALTGGAAVLKRTE